MQYAKQLFRRQTVDRDFLKKSAVRPEAASRACFCPSAYRCEEVTQRRIVHSGQLKAGVSRSFRPARASAQEKAQIQEVEIKLRLPSQEAHAAVAEALKSSYKVTHQQENYFFDGSNRELSSNRVVLRCRFYNHDKKALITCKGRQILKDGIGRGTELETTTDPVAARDFLSEPDKLLALDVDFIQDLKKEYGVEHLKFLGGFRNERSEYEYEGHTLELDETKYDWGTLFEIEVESVEPEALKVKLEAFLGSRAIPYSYSATTKFANFINRTLE